MKHLIALTIGLGLALAQTPNQSYVYLADDLERTPQTLELGANFLTELVAWLPIEEAKSARADLLRLERDPRNPNLLNLASRPSAKGLTDLFLKVDGRTLRFRLLLGTRTAPGRCLILLERPRAGQPTVIVREPSPSETPTPTPTHPTIQGPIPAPPMEAAAALPAAPPGRKGAYFGLSLGYPPLPVSGSLAFNNLWYGAVVGIEEVLWGLDLQLGGAYLPSLGAGLLEGYAVLPFSRNHPLNFYLGMGGGIVLLGSPLPYLGGMAGVELRLGEGLVGFLELTPRYILLPGGNQVIVGGRLGLKIRP